MIGNFVTEFSRRVVSPQLFLNFCPSLWQKRQPGTSVVRFDWVRLRRLRGAPNDTYMNRMSRCINSWMRDRYSSFIVSLTSN